MLAGCFEQGGWPRVFTKADHIEGKETRSYVVTWLATERLSVRDV